MRIQPFEVANDHLLRKDRTFYKDDKGNLAWDDDHMPLHVTMTGLREEDEPEQKPEECFAPFNQLEFPVLRGLNGFGKMTHTAKEVLEQTSEQFAWSGRPTRQFTYDECTGGNAMPIPKPKRRNKRN